MATDTLIAKQIRPFVGRGRATVAESPVDQVQSESGLILPLVFDGDDNLHRGVLLAVCYDPAVPALADEARHLLPGGVVWYQRGVKIADVVIVDLYDVLAYEEDE